MDKIKIIDKKSLVVFWFIILFVLLEYANIISVLPVSKYRRESEMSVQNTCGKIQESSDRELCMEIIKSDNFQEGLNIMVRQKKYSADDYPWYDFPYVQNPQKYHGFPGGIEAMLSEGKKQDSSEWCENVYLSYTLLEEDYYFCRAFLENPYYCGKISYHIGPSRGICYQDAALVWNDPSLCESAENKNFCYIRLALDSLDTR